MKKERGFTTLELIVAVIFVLGFGGWINNIVILVNTPLDPLTMEIVLRLVGILMVPLGMVMGFL